MVESFAIVHHCPAAFKVENLADLKACRLLYHWCVTLCKAFYCSRPANWPTGVHDCFGDRLEI